MTTRRRHRLFLDHKPPSGGLVVLPDLGRHARLHGAQRGGARVGRRRPGAAGGAVPLPSTSSTARCWSARRDRPAEAAPVVRLPAAAGTPAAPRGGAVPRTTSTPTRPVPTRRVVLTRRARRPRPRLVHRPAPTRPPAHRRPDGREPRPQRHRAGRAAGPEPPGAHHLEGAPMTRGGEPGGRPGRPGDRGDQGDQGGQGRWGHPGDRGRPGDGPGHGPDPGRGPGRPPGHAHGHHGHQATTGHR